MNSNPIVRRGSLTRSSLRFVASCLGALALSAAVSSSVQAAVVYDESIMGDISGLRLAPTSITLREGSNQVFGTLFRAATGGTTESDYFTVTVPSGFTLNSLIELPGTTAGGRIPQGFIGFSAGPIVVQNGGSAAGLLGWHHYTPGDAGSDLFPFMAVPAAGSSGFTAPLAEGQYAFWVQDFTPGSYTWGFDLQVARAVPEPSTYGLIGAGLIGLLAVRRRFSKTSKSA